MADLKKAAARRALRGIEKLAFGKTNDAVSLILRHEEIDGQELKKLDISCISEIRQPKGGGFEIKFIDRLKAFEMLLDYEGRRDDTPEAGSLYEALSESARAIGSVTGGDADAI